MKPNPATPFHHDLLLVGGGHSHLAVIKQLAMKPIAGLRVTVISNSIHTPYSGMVPGMIAGHYHFDDAHIDLRKLCQSAGVRLIQGNVTNINPDLQLVYCHDRAPFRYDYLSINIGSQPALSTIKGAAQQGVAVKPIAQFLNYWQQLVAQPNNSPQDIAIVGGGAASVEVALACQYQLDQRQLSQYTLHLYCATATLLPSHNKRVQTFMRKRLLDSGVQIHLNKTVVAVSGNQQQTEVAFSDNTRIQCQHLIWAIHAGSPSWLKATGLACDAKGFISVNQYLQSCSHSNVFAAGDIAHFEPIPLAKSGVYAVRAGITLSENLCRAINGKALKAFKPQKHFLSLLMTGDKYAIASKSRLSFSGRWVWRWKDHIDRKFMAMYHVPAQPAPSPQPQLSKQTDNMRCGGCGAKVGSSILNRVMARLDIIQQPDIPVGLHSPDDAAVINPPAGKQWLQTVDYFRAFIDDPYLLGRIATNHCLSDIYAMGGQPHSALAIATVPYAEDKLVEDTLFQLMSGAVDSLNQQHTALIGGHSSEGAELGFGLSVNGVIDPQKLLTKGTLSQGQALILSKPLGTGILLAANMHAQADGQWIENAIQQMLINNQLAAQLFQQFNATACTDITGFGLSGHLSEMLKAGQHNATIALDPIPVLAGAVQCAANGYVSSLYPDNLKAKNLISNNDSFQQHPLYPLLFDPQTAGGLLAAVSATQAADCLQALQQADCPDAAIIGYISGPSEQASPLITLTQSIEIK